MMQQKIPVGTILVIAGIFVLIGFLGGFVSGMVVSVIPDPGLREAAGTFLQYAGLGLIIVVAMKLLSQYYTRPLAQEMKEEENREAEQKEGKQVLFKPTTSIIIFFLLMILLGISVFIPVVFSSEPLGDVLDRIVVSLFLIVLFLLFWYWMPVLLFTEDSVQIKSHIFYLLGIDRKTVFKFADITSVGPNRNGNYGWGVEPKHSLMISVNGTTQGYGLFGFDDDAIAKIWLRFKEKLGDKIHLE